MARAWIPLFQDWCGSRISLIGLIHYLSILYAHNIISSLQEGGDGKK